MDIRSMMIFSILLKKREPGMAASLFAICFLGVLFFWGAKNLEGLGRATLLAVQQGKESREIWTGVENKLNENFFLKYRFVDLNGLWQRMNGRRDMRDILKLRDGRLTGHQGRIDQALLADGARQVAEFISRVKEMNIRCLYVQVPTNIDKYDPQTPTGAEAVDANANIDIFVNFLRQDGVEVMDIREEIHNDGSKLADYFSRTDHHWSMKGVFYAFSKVGRILQKEGILNIDDSFFDIKNYRVDTYPNIFLGSSGRRVGVCFAGKEDFYSIIPKFHTSLRNMDSEHDFSDFETALIDKRAVEKIWPYNYASYDYLFKAYQIENELSNNNKKILIVSDSFMHRTSPYFGLVFKQSRIWSLDGKNALEFIKSYKPDVVLVEIWNGNYTNKLAFNFATV